MESLIKIRNLKIEYIEGSSISLDIEEGEIVALTGPNGSGKSTLAAYISGIYLPEEPDKVVVGGLDTSFPVNTARLHRKCGIVFQNPDDNHVFDMVSADAMFGLENLNLPAEETVKKTKYFLKKYGLLKKADRNIRTLSGGERQRAAVAAILAMEPHILILDESFSMQSGTVRDKMVDYVIGAARKNGQTVIMITQYPEVAKRCDRVIRLEKGVVKNDHEDLDEESHEKTNGESIIQKLSEYTEAVSLSELNQEIKSFTIEERVLEEQDGAVDAARALYLDHVGFSYGKEPVLSDIFYAFGRGRAYIVRGESGSGKSTLAMLLNGLLLAKKGRIFLDGRQLPVTKKRINPARKDPDVDDGMISDINALRRKVGYVSQNPEKQLFADSVIKDVMFGPRNLGFDNNGAVKMARNALSYMNVDETVWKRHVDQISGGEKRRVGIAGIIANAPDYLILDESDAGLDENGIDALSGVIKSYLEAGKCVILIGHDE
ncbi:MAG: ATP-binding cassette domain-containing protein [Eubacterium sp.]|nr:ATP-binding cassette domain-containing protein [Eubacterium sp.]